MMPYKRNSRLTVCLLTIALLLATHYPALTQAFPLDGYPETGIRRLEADRLANAGTIQGRKQLPGGLLVTADIDLRLLEHRELELPAPDPEFSKQLLRLSGVNASRYGLAVLDISDPEHLRYGEHRGAYRQNVGSVGKLLVALGLFQALADAWPFDVEKRRQILKETNMTADSFSLWDHHKIRLFDVENRQLVKRPMETGDRGSLWEFLDWTLSVSSNAAAGMIMRDAMLLRHYGRDYPPPEDEIQRFFNDTPRKELTRLFQQTFFDPVTRNGLHLDQFRQGSFFTRKGKQRVPGGGTSHGTARELIRYSLLMEQGRLVDEFSSRQIKRLLYMTERRIRYASAPALRTSAIYFKSGSFYSCEEEPGFTCKKYMGNRKNYMNSLAIIETQAGGYSLNYITAVISNVLRENSAVAHQTLATRIHRLLEQDHPPLRPAPIVDTEAARQPVVDIF